MALFQTTVPNTYAATKASLTVGWGPKGETNLVHDPSLTAQCDCGQRRHPDRPCCDRCQAMESGTSCAHVDALVLAQFSQVVEATLGYLVEALAKKYSRKIVYQACRRLVQLNKLARRPIKKPGESFLYRLHSK